MVGGNNLYRFEGTVQNQVDPLGLVVQVIAASWLLEALAYTTTAMTGILVGVGIMDAMEESEDSSDSSSTPITIGAEETNDIGKCANKPKCPDDVYNRLTENVNRAKAYSASLRKCLETMTNAELQLRIDAANAEINARIEREDTCWDGGDSGHQQQIRDIRKRINKCMRYMR